MDNSAEKQFAKSWITEGITIAASPLVAYMLLYGYETGFADAFSIPRAFITLELPGIITIAVVILVLTSIYFFMIIPLLRSRRMILKKIAIALVLGAFLSPNLLSYFATGRKIVTLVFLTIYLSITIVLLLYRREFPPIEYLGRLIGEKLVRVLLLLISLMSIFLLMNVIGQIAARYSEDYLVSKTSPEMVVLRIYRDKLICAPFDRAAKEVKRTFTILKTGDDPNLKLSIEKVGPLHIEKQPVEK